MIIVLIAVAKPVEALKEFVSSRLCFSGFNNLKAIGNKIRPPIACRKGMVNKYVAIKVMIARITTAPAVPI